jgi:hypothetical protein
LIFFLQPPVPGSGVLICVVISFKKAPGYTFKRWFLSLLISNAVTFKYVNFQLRSGETEKKDNKEVKSSGNN